MGFTSARSCVCSKCSKLNREFKNGPSPLKISDLHPCPPPPRLPPPPVFWVWNCTELTLSQHRLLWLSWSMHRGGATDDVNPELPSLQQPLRRRRCVKPAMVVHTKPWHAQIASFPSIFPGHMRKHHTPSSQSTPSQLLLDVGAGHPHSILPWANAEEACAWISPTAWSKRNAAARPFLSRYPLASLSMRQALARAGPGDCTRGLDGRLGTWDRATKRGFDDAIMTHYLHRLPQRIDQLETVLLSGPAAFRAIANRMGPGFR